MNDSKRFMGAGLNRGISKGNLLTFYIASFVIIMLAVSCNVLQPYILTTFLGIRISEHGSATGMIALVGEIVLLITVGVWGVISDRTGRRFVLVMGFLIVGLGFMITPLAKTLGMLIGFRALYSIGSAATTGMLATVIADYVINEDRGKANAIMGVFIGLGAMTGALLIGRLPQIYAKTMNQDGISAGWSSYLTVVCIAVVIAIVMRIGLKGGVPESGDKWIGFKDKVKEGLASAKRDTGVALSYAAAFVSRADNVVCGLFFPLWLSKHFQAALPVDATADMIDKACQEGIVRGGILIGIVGGGSMVFAPIIGVLCDRINRVTALAIGLGMNVIGYGLIFFVDDPTGVFIIIAAVIIGFGQTGGVIASQVLIQQQAIPKFRGSIIGFFGMCGGFGIMLISWSGGIIFDVISEQAPFVLLAALNLVVVIIALAVKSRVHAPEHA